MPPLEIIGRMEEKLGFLYMDNVGLQLVVDDRVKEGVREGRSG